MERIEQYLKDTLLIIHLHGFSSVGNNAKFTMLKWAFKEEKIVSPTLPCDPPETLKLIEAVLEQHLEPTITIGTSLGGFYAYYLAVVLQVPAIIINPSLKPWETLKHRIGLHKRLESNDEFLWKEDAAPFLEEMGRRIESSYIPEKYLNFYLANDDELIDHSEIPRLFPNARTIKFFDNSGHVFKKFQKILPDVKKLLDEVKRGEI